MGRFMLAATAALTLLGGNAAQAAILDFDDVDITGAPFGYFEPLGPSYHGLTWTNWALIDVQNYGASGYTNGNVTLRNTACACANDFGQTVDTISGATPFRLDSGYFTSAWNDGATLVVTGLLGGNQVAQNSFVLNTSGPSFLTFGWVVDTLEFSISGGVDNPVLLGAGDYFGVDNLSISAVPEPATWSLVLLGIGALGAGLRGRRRALA